MLHKLYQYHHEDERYNNRESQDLERKITTIIQHIDFEKAKQDEDYMFNLFCEARAYSEEKGFVQGFQYAVQLLLCCMLN